MSIHGILPIIKPKGLTSHDCVMKVRKLLKTKKVGHTGTLDPDVIGVLPICVGKATKLVEYMSDYAKTYVAEVTIGIATTTEDASGEVIETKRVSETFTEQDIERVLAQFQGEITQTPPMYSAVKVNGKRLYEYARAGKVIKRPSRQVMIHNIELLPQSLIENEGATSFSIRVHCSKGTYIRTLSVDIGKAFGYPAHMSKLERIQSGPFSIEQCVTFEEIADSIEKGELESLLYTIDDGLADFEKVTVDDELANKILHGSVLEAFADVHAPRFAIYNQAGDCLAIYQNHPTKPGLVKPEKMFYTVQ